MITDNKNVILFSLCLLVSFGLLATGCVRFAEVYVDANASGPGDGTVENPFATITRGLDAVASGGMVHVAPGDYFENLIISRPVNLLGAGAETTRVLAEITSSGIKIISEDVSINGFSIVGIGESLPENYAVGGIYSEGMNNTSITENIIGPYYSMGIGIGTSSSVLVRDNQVRQIEGVAQYENSGIVVLSCNDVTISGNIIEEVDGQGIVIAGTTGILENNTFSNNAGGLMLGWPLDEGTELSMNGNLVTENLHSGLLLIETTLTEFNDNTIIDNFGYGLDIMDIRLISCELIGGEDCELLPITQILACGGNINTGNNPDFVAPFTSEDPYIQVSEEIQACFQ